MTKGRLIVIEGLDGSGKETQAKLLFEALKKDNDKTILVSFPNYKSKGCVLVEDYLQGKFVDYHNSLNVVEAAFQASSFYMFDRLYTFLNTKNEKGQNLFEMYEDGYTIICDRYLTSNLIHQTAKMKDKVPEGLIVHFITTCMSVEPLMLNLPLPTKVLFLNVSEDISMKNIEKRYNNDESKKDIHENVNHLKKARDVYETYGESFGWINIDCMNGETQKTIEEIHNMIKNNI